MSNPRPNEPRPGRQRDERGRGGEGERAVLNPGEIEQIIVQGNVEVLVTAADRIGRRLKDEDLKTSQIRNVFGTVRQIQMRWPSSPAKAHRDAVLLRPKLAYFAKREKGRGMETLQSALEPALKMLEVNEQPNRERFDHFVEFFEAIVAYHRKYGGRDQ